MENTVQKDLLRVPCGDEGIVQMFLAQPCSLLLGPSEVDNLNFHIGMLTFTLWVTPYPLACLLHI